MRGARFGLLGHLDLGRGRGPWAEFRGRDRLPERASQQLPLLALDLVEPLSVPGGEAEVVADLALLPGVQEEDVVDLRVEDDQRAERDQRQRRRPSPAFLFGRPLKVHLLGPRKGRRLGSGPLERFDPARGLARQLGPIDHVSPRLLEPHFLDEDQASTGQYVHSSEDLGDSGHQGPSDPFVELLGTTSEGAVPLFLVPVVHQSIEQLAHPDLGPRGFRKLPRLANGGMEFDGAREISPRTAQEKFPDGSESRVARIGEDRHQSADQVPPVSQRRPGQSLQRLVERGIAVPPLDITDDGRGGEEP